jgi:hypothetical protein
MKATRCSLYHMLENPDAERTSTFRVPAIQPVTRRSEEADGDALEN